ncbi:MAG TPA: winged helix-turn-helix domain-containing protein [Terriglobales bacterium]|nr:winged helix-turn-helix domain-containing protein [Terriglobales bacterium]
MEVIGRAVKTLYAFGPFSLDPLKRIVLRNGEPIPLTPKVFDILLVLVQSSGQPLTRDELMKLVWPDSFVEEGNLTQNISVLRKTLGNGKRYIVTIPGRGYQFAEPVRELNGAEASATQGGSTAPAKRTAAFRVLWPVLLLAALVVSGLSLVLAHRQPGATALSSRPTTPAPVLQERRSVAVLGFRNLSRKRDKDWLSTAIAEMLTTELAAGQQIRTVPGEDVSHMRISLALPDADPFGAATLARIRSNVHADDLVFGSYVLLGNGQVRLDLRAQDAVTGELIAALSEKASQARIDELVSRAGAALRQKFAVAPLTPAQTAAVMASLPADSRAKEIYASGLAKLRLLDNLGARKLLLEVLTIEPAFAPGHLALSWAWGNLGYDQKALEEAKKAFDTSGRLDRPEQLRIEGRYRETNHEWDKAVDTYHTLFEFFPDSLDDGLHLAEAQAKAGKFPYALHTVERLRRLPSSGDDPRIDEEESVIAGEMGDFKGLVVAALRAMHGAQAQGARLITAAAEKDACSGYLRLGRQEDAKKLCEDARQTFGALGDRNGEAGSLLFLARIWFDGGDPGAGIRMIKEAIAGERAVGNAGGTASALIYLGNFLDDQGDTAQAGLRFEEAAAICRETGNTELLAYALGNAGMVAQRLGQLEKAERMKEETIAVLRQTGDMGGLGEAHMNLGHTLWSKGDVVGAKRNYEEALKILRDFGELGDLASTEADLAEVALSQGQMLEAKALLRQAAEDSRRARDQIAELHVDTILLKLLLADSRPVEAQKQVQQARSFSDKVPDVAEQLSFAIAAAQAGAATDAAHAERDLASLAAQARKAGELENEFSARLALGKIQLKRGNNAAGRATLTALRREAAAKGFGLIVRDSNSTLSANPFI